MGEIPTKTAKSARILSNAGTKIAANRTLWGAGPGVLISVSFIGAGRKALLKTDQRSSSLIDDCGSEALLVVLLLRRRWQAAELGKQVHECELATNILKGRIAAANFSVAVSVITRGGFLCEGRQWRF